MCGIAGIVSCDRLDSDGPVRALRMRDVMTHRGPDEAGLHCDAFAALAHRRLSIVDLKTGQQPLSNEDGGVWVVFNGEIYNHAHLRVTLQAKGHGYRTRSDTESIVHAYEEWGEACAQHFRGMFAFAIWDAPRRRLLLVRDRLGVKPLYWARVRDRLLFASEIKAILASGLIRPESNTEALAEMLATGSIAGEETMFRGIHKLLPGHQLVFEDGTISIHQYWDVPTATSAAARGPVDAMSRRPVQEFAERLEEAVRLRLMSDVPLGVFLSGGLDSSAIAAVAARLIGRPLKTFSVAFKDRAFNELEYSRTVARAIGAESYETVIDDRDFFAALPRLVWHEDEPIAHPSSVALYFVSTLARRHVTVVLSGEGSDELLAGYGRYTRAAWNWQAGGIYQKAVPKTWRAAVARAVVPRLPARMSRVAGRTFLAMDRTPEMMFFDNFAFVPIAAQRQVLPARQPADGASPYGSALAYFNRPPQGSTLLDRLLYADMKTYLVELLMRQDQMSMAASIESRVPFLDHELVEFASQLPDHWKRQGLTTKRILREAVKNLLPASILKRPKMGFPVPFGPWIRDGWHPVVRDVLLDRRSRERGLVDIPAVERLLADHAAGRATAGNTIWALLNLELWHRTFIDQEGIQTLPEARIPHAHSLAQVRSVAAAR